MDQYIFETPGSSIMFITYINQCKCSKRNNFWRICNKGNIQLPHCQLRLEYLKQENWVVELIIQMFSEEIKLVSKCKQ